MRLEKTMKTKFLLYIGNLKKIGINILWMKVGFISNKTFPTPTETQ